MKKIHKTSAVILFVVVAASAATISFFVLNKKSPGVEVVNAKNGLALEGYDAVAYFQEGKPTHGKQAFQHEWQGAKWFFANALNRDAFASAPEKYAPQYGGYCSWAVSHGYTANGDPQAWKIIDGKLYLNYNLEVREEWEKDTTNYINAGNKNWQMFLFQKPEHKGN